MLFTHDTQEALVVATALVNTDLVGDDSLRTLDDLERFMGRFPFSGVRTHDEAELVGVRNLRPTLRAVWNAADRPAAAALVNAMLTETRAMPQLVIHDHLDWHIHATAADAPLAQRMGAEAAMAFVDLVRSDNLDRLRHCAGQNCSAVLVDLSRNRSRRFCDTGNCGNREHVAAYRARLAERS